LYRADPKQLGKPHCAPKTESLQPVGGWGGGGGGSGGAVKKEKRRFPKGQQGHAGRGTWVRPRGAGGSQSDVSGTEKESWKTKADRGHKDLFRGLGQVSSKKKQTWATDVKGSPTRNIEDVGGPEAGGAGS